MIKVGDNAVLSTALFTRTNGSVGTLGNVSLGFVPAAPNPAAANGAGAGGDTGGPPMPWETDAALAGDPSQQGSEDAIDPSIEAAIAALRGQSTDNPLSMFAIPGDPASFDRIAELRGLAAPAMAGESIAMELAPSERSLPAALVAVESATVDASLAETDTARQLALLRQDMAAFGPGSGMDRLEWRQPLDAPLGSFM